MDDEDMDMDMFMPQPDELEWLEANSHLHEEDEAFFYDPEPPEPEPPRPEPEPEPYIDPETISKPVLTIPAKSTIPICAKSPSFTDPKSISNSNKRPVSLLTEQLNTKKSRNDTSVTDPVSISKSIKRPVLGELVTDQLNAKKSRNDASGTDNDEDWLSYTPQSEPEKVHVVDAPKERIVSRFASEIDGDCIPVTGLDGDRVYAKIHRAERKTTLRNSDMHTHSNGGLMLEPINLLLQRVEQEAFTKALHASSEGQQDEILPQTSVVKEQLWVDKYAPNSFTELLSDEHTNREVLLWLKQWDSCVFGSDIRSTGEEVLSALRRHSSIQIQRKPSARSFVRNDSWSKPIKTDFTHSTNINQESVDTKGVQESWSKKSKLTAPSEQKIILLCGPPGLGKTTLAHVAAKHCGYRVVEINASDDRSSSRYLLGEFALLYHVQFLLKFSPCATQWTQINASDDRSSSSIEAKIQDVVQMNYVMADSRPKCLVIDEIDGALGDGKGAVEVILKMVSADRKSDNGSDNIAEGQSGRPPSKKKHKKASLSRPIICICNDLYAPALRQLRQVAKVHTFVQPTVSRVVSRLKYICNKEGLRTSSIALTALAEYTRCDIRSCLNTLQFLHKKKETLNVMEISSQVVGQKDISRSVIDIWKEIFQKKKMRREKNASSGGGRLSNEFNSLYSLVSSRGDYDLIYDGIHENMLQLNYHDPLMQKTVKCINSLGVSDLIHQYIMHTQKMLLYVYQPSIAITAHNVIAQVERPNIEWPKSFHRYRTTSMQKMEVFRSWHYKIWPSISRHLSTKSFVEDSISPLLHILSPPSFRPVALHSLSEKAKDDLVQLVGTMVSYSITYKNVKLEPQIGIMTHEGALDASLLCFDPLINDFISFKGYKPGHYVLSLAMKQILVHEVEKQKILHVSVGRHAHLPDGRQENQALTSKENNRAEIGKTDHAVSLFKKNIEIANSKVNPELAIASTSNTSTSDSVRDATTNMNLKSSGGKKKASGGPFNYFERFVKLNGKGAQKTDKAVQKEATMERDSRPLLYKFNEGYTNAVKRPVRMREFLQ